MCADTSRMTFDNLFLRFRNIAGPSQSAVLFEINVHKNGIAQVSYFTKICAIYGASFTHFLHGSTQCVMRIPCDHLPISMATTLNNRFIYMLGSGEL